MIQWVILRFLFLIIRIFSCSSSVLTLRLSQLKNTLDIIYSTTAQSAGTEDYTVASLQTSKTLPSIHDMTLNHLMVRLQTWSFGEYQEHLSNSLFYSDLRC